jgi:hypothetical protein
MARRYGAPWSLLLKGITFGVITVMTLVVLLAWTRGEAEPVPRFIMTLPLLVVGATAFWAVLGYEIGSDVLEIRRPLHVTRIPLRGLREVREDPRAMQRALRVFGNGGMFAFTGLFRNREVGRFRAYVTDRGRAVFLFFDDGRTICVSPDDPRGFARRLRRAAGLEEPA